MIADFCNKICHYQKWEAIPLLTHGYLLYRLE